MVIRDLFVFLMLSLRNYKTKANYLYKDILTDKQKERGSEPLKILYDKDREKLLIDILEQKRDAYFVPTYNVAISSETVQERPVSFKDFEEWFTSIRLENKNKEEKGYEDSKTKENLRKSIKMSYEPFIYNRMMKVN